MFLVPHDKDKYLKYFEKISGYISSLKEKMNPKKKFKFSNRKDKVEIKKEDIIITTETKNVYSVEDLVLCNLNDTKKVITPLEITGKKNIIIENLNKAIIIIPFTVKSLFAKNVKDSKIFIAAVDGGSHITNFHYCEVYICTHQLRIHDSDNNHFSILTNSKPIIEKCCNFEFSNIFRKFNNEELVMYLKNSNLKIEDNKWEEIQDFQWLKTEESPNYKLNRENLTNKQSVEKLINKTN